MQKLEIWPQRSMYFAAAIAIHHSDGGGTFHGGWHFIWRVAYPWRGLTLVLTWLKAGIHGGSAKPKVLLLANPLELQQQRVALSMEGDTFHGGWHISGG